ncbi:MAG: MBL fold metallo-hydrolase [Candidatus Nanoarchaeia archaeon]
MERFIIILLVVSFFVTGCFTVKTEQPAEQGEIMELGVNLQHLGHASFKIADGKTIYIDPFKLKSSDKADIILITHSHYDHCSMEDIEKIIKSGTEIFIPPDCQSKINHFDNVSVTLVYPNKVYNSGNIKIETVPSYNLNKKFHPKENEWVGYVITVNNKRIYHAGDSDFIPEMKNLKSIDIALLPIGGTYTMNVDEAAQAANAIRPKFFIPMHYNAISGTEADPGKLQGKVDKSIKVLVI